jgi:hypothetical protein
VIDVEAIRLHADGIDVGAEFGKQPRREVIGRAVRAIQDNLPATQVRPGTVARQKSR